MSSNLVRAVDGGDVEGAVRRGLRMWRGIPYAAAPIGDLRFRGPAPVEPWSGVRLAAEFGPVAPQDRDGMFLGPPRHIPMGEDCLSLNVMSPDSDTAHPRPVMVFIHGGAYSVGSSREVRYLGESLVRDGDILFVNFNYRLGALGYLDFSSFSSPSRVFETNLGLRDQLQALEWVQRCIVQFGGDPRNVTLFGESAGGNAVTTLMSVPRAEGLFARAIAQSSPTNAIYPPEVTAEWGREFVELLSEVVDDADIESATPDDGARLLATASTDELVRATTMMQRRAPDRLPGTIALAPVIDGDLLPERPLDAFKAGRAHRIPLIIGTNDREGSLFRGRLDILATTPPRIRFIFSKTRKKARKRLKAQYPGLPAPRAAADFAGDYAFWFPSVKVAERHAEYAQVYAYRFDIAPRLVRVAGFDATHGLELYALFDRMDERFGRLMGALGGRRAFQRTGERMRRHWLRFARDGRLDDWPRYTRRRRRTLIFDRVDRIELDPRAERRLAWQDFVPHI